LADKCLSSLAAVDRSCPCILDPIVPCQAHGTKHANPRECTLGDDRFVATELRGAEPLGPGPEWIIINGHRKRAARWLVCQRDRTSSAGHGTPEKRQPRIQTPHKRAIARRFTQTGKKLIACLQAQARGRT
jgi:hypothetical protein